MMQGKKKKREREFSDYLLYCKHYHIRFGYCKIIQDPLQVQVNDLSTFTWEKITTVLLRY